jgi:hypothetical protein
MGKGCPFRKPKLNKEVGSLSAMKRKPHICVPIIVDVARAPRTVTTNSRVGLGLNPFMSTFF